MRDTTQLPATQELRAIMDFEAKRDVPPEKEGVHYPSFDPLFRLAAALEVDVSLLKKGFTRDEWMAGGPLEEGDALVQALVDRLLQRPDLDRRLLDGVYDYLAEEDPLEPAEAIFVFGAKTPLRIQKAVELYQAGWARKLVLSGHGPYSNRGEKAEAGIYRDLAVAAGVPSEDILLETRSITIPDNVRTSLNLFDEIGFAPKSLILVNSPYVQRRGWALFKKYTPETVRIIRQNCGTGEKFSREQWFKNPEGAKVVINEFAKMKIAVVLNTA